MVYVLHVVKIEEGQQHTPWTLRNKTSDISVDVSLSNALPPTKISRAASSADWMNRLISTPYVCVCVCVQHCTLLCVGSGCCGVPEAATRNLLLSHIHFLPRDGDVSFSAALLFLPFCSLTLPPLLRVISQTLLKWLPAIRPKSQLHVIWCCQL